MIIKKVTRVKSLGRWQLREIANYSSNRVDFFHGRNILIWPFCLFK